jgi:hypothetical protein
VQRVQQTHVLKARGFWKYPPFESSLQAMRSTQHSVMGRQLLAAACANHKLVMAKAHYFALYMVSQH